MLWDKTEHIFDIMSVKRVKHINGIKAAKESEAYMSLRTD
jgi:hypothetical protein